MDGPLQRRHLVRSRAAGKAAARNSGLPSASTESRSYTGLRSFGEEQVFLVSLHGVGRDTGVMAVTTCCEIERSSGPEGGARFEDVELPNEAFHFVHEETVEQLDLRRAELESLLEEALAVALAALQSRLR